MDYESLRRMVLKPCTRANVRDAQSDLCICMYHHNKNENHSHKMVIIFVTFVKLVDFIDNCT